MTHQRLGGSKVDSAAKDRGAVGPSESLQGPFVALTLRALAAGTALAVQAGALGEPLQCAEHLVIRIVRRGAQDQGAAGMSRFPLL